MYEDDMEIVQRISKYNYDRAITQYIKEANGLYRILFVEPIYSNRREELNRRLDWLTRYEFLTKLFNDIGIYNWMYKETLEK